MGFRDKIDVIKQVPNDIKVTRLIAITALVLAGLALIVAIGRGINAN